MSLRYSQLKDKPLHRLKHLTTKFFKRIGELNSIIINCKNFEIPIDENTLLFINKKIHYYWEELYKVNDVRNFKYNDLFKGSLGKWIEEK